MKTLSRLGIEAEESSRLNSILQNNTFRRNNGRCLSPAMAMINHSCDPNCRVYWSRDNGDRWLQYSTLGINVYFYNFRNWFQKPVTFNDPPWIIVKKYYSLNIVQQVKDWNELIQFNFHESSFHWVYCQAGAGDQESSERWRRVEHHLLLSIIVHPRQTSQADHEQTVPVFLLQVNDLNLGYQTNDSASSSKIHHFALLALLVALVSCGSNFHH